MQGQDQNLRQTVVVAKLRWELSEVTCSSGACALAAPSRKSFPNKAASKCLTNSLECQVLVTCAPSMWMGDKRWHSNSCNRETEYPCGCSVLTTSRSSPFHPWGSFDSAGRFSLAWAGASSPPGALLGSCLGDPNRREPESRNRNIPRSLDLSGSACRVTHSSSSAARSASP